MSSDIFVIYQIDNSDKNREYRCRSYEYQIQHGFMITADNYGTGYSGTKRFVKRWKALTRTNSKLENLGSVMSSD